MKGALLALLAGLGLATVQAHAGEEAGWQPVQLPHSSQRDLHSQRTGKDYRIFVSELDVPVNDLVELDPFKDLEPPGQGAVLTAVFTGSVREY